MKCLGKDRNNNNCRYNGSPFCKNHDYMKEYTSEMLNNLQLCKGCKKMYYFDSDIKQCHNCRERAKEVRTKTKQHIILCKSEGCSFKKSDKNDYCGKHQLCLFVDDCIAEGLRPCIKYIKGCRTKLSSDYIFKSCHACLEKERKNDNLKRSEVSSFIVDGNKQCSVCCNFKKINEYIGMNNQETKTCSDCRESFKKQDSKRNNERVKELDRIASKKPERKEKKLEWRKENQYKVVLANLNYRDKQHNTNQEEYLKRNAEIMAKWREKNPEKVKEINKKNILNIGHQYNGYYRKSEKYRLSFELTIKDFEEIVKMPCYYCSIIQEKGFNGIDRKEQTKGYIIENCVSCCKLCNFLKGAVDNITFLQRVEHILKYNSIILNGNYYPDAFKNHKSISYKNYKNRAKKNNYTFDILVEDFNKIILENCYICGKKNDKNHINGLDRFDNNIGYTIDNIKACCGQCNYMKKNIKYDIFISQLQNIYNHCSKNKTTEPGEIITNIMSENINKMNKIEIKEYQQQKKQIKQKLIREKYSDEEFKKKHALELVIARNNEHRYCELPVSNDR